jgi:hypothetical protein
MGMDVYGRNPTAEAGNYFRASIWSWRAIHGLIAELCADLFDQEALDGLAVKSGNGPADQATCTEMANRFGRWMEQNVNERSNDPEGRIRETPFGATAFAGTFQELMVEVANPSVSKVTDEHLKAWVVFLRHCGGFMVY